MSLEVRLGQRQEQRLALLPQMLQSIEVLQLATDDLLQFLEQEVQQNETLELRAIEPPQPEVRADAPEREDSGWTEWRRGPAGDGDAKQDFLDNVPSATDTLLEFVQQQLAFRGVDSELSNAVLQIVQRLDERGLLPFAVGDVATEVGAPVELMEQAHQLLLTLEPRGIGARDPIDAMLMQATGDPDLPAIERLLREHLDSLSRNKLPDVARAMDLTLDDLGELIERIKALDPRPAAAFHDSAAAPLRADATVWLRDGVLNVSLDDSAMPELSVNEDYAAMAGDRKTTREVRDYLRPKLRSARDLIDAVRLRQQTLLRVVQAVMREQTPFLTKGKSAIRPMRMAEIADRLGLHASTISRAIAGKHVQTDRGVFRLRDFFDGGRIDAAPTAGQGRMAIAQQIADLVAAENKSAPLSDDDVVAALAQRGVQAARRTVTKYRKELGIPSSYLRRRFGGES